MPNNPVRSEIKRTLQRLQRQLQKYSQQSGQTQSHQSDLPLNNGKNDTKSPVEISLLQTQYLLITHLELVVDAVLQFDNELRSIDVLSNTLDEIGHNTVLQDSTIPINYTIFDQINMFQHNHIRPLINTLENDAWWWNVENNLFEDAYWKNDIQIDSDVIDTVYYTQFDRIHNESTLLFDFDSFELNDEGVIEDVELDLEQIFDEETEYDQELSGTVNDWEYDNDDDAGEEYEDDEGYVFMDEDIDADDHQPDYREYYYRLYNDTSDYDENDEYDDM